jgi:hypothetical protein
MRETVILCEKQGAQGAQAIRRARLRIFFIMLSLLCYYSWFILVVIFTLADEAWRFTVSVGN